MNPLLIALLREVVVPIVTSFFHEFFTNHGRLPTLDEVKQHLDEKEAVMTMQGETLINALQSPVE